MPRPSYLNDTNVLAALWQAWQDSLPAVSRDIVASFHTHPNISSDYLQEPSETDRRAVCDDPDLKGRFYEGELVISQTTIYLIESHGQVSEVGKTKEILAKG